MSDLIAGLFVGFILGYMVGFRVCLYASKRYIIDKVKNEMEDCQPKKNSV